MESSGHSRWFEPLVHELGLELGIGDPAGIWTKRVRKQKTDRQDAQLILQLMLENRFPRVRGEPGNPDGVQSITDVMTGHPAPSK